MPINNNGDFKFILDNSFLPNKRQILYGGKSKSPQTRAEQEKALLDEGKSIINDVKGHYNDAKNLIDAISSKDAYKTTQIVQGIIQKTGLPIASSLVPLTAGLTDLITGTNHYKPGQLYNLTVDALPVPKLVKDALKSLLPQVNQEEVDKFHRQTRAKYDCLNKYRQFIDQTTGKVKPGYKNIPDCNALGGSLFSKAYQKIANIYRKRYCPKSSRPLYEHEYHPSCQNYEGPGTRIDLENVRNAPSINETDKYSRIHDLAYDKAKHIKNPEERAIAIHKADQNFIRDVSKVKGEEPERSLGLAGIGGKFHLEQLLSTFLQKPTVIYGGRFQTRPMYNF